VAVQLAESRKWIFQQSQELKPIKKEVKMGWQNYYTGICPNCNSENYYCYDDEDGYENNCLDCGYFSKGDSGFLSLEQVNELREKSSLEPLEELKEPGGEE